MLNIFLKTLSWIIEKIPYWACRWIAGFLGFILYRVIRLRRNIVLENLKNCLGSKYSNRELSTIARRTYTHFALMLLEFIRMPGMTEDELKSKLHIHGDENFLTAYNKGRGIVVASGHIGCWELGPASIVFHGFPTSAYARPVHNKVINDWVNGLRQAHKIQVISKKYSLRDLINSLKEQNTIAFLIDQDAGRHGIFIDFMGRPASTYQGPAYCAIKADCPVVPCFVFRREDYDYDVFIESPIYPNTATPIEIEILRITQQVSESLESYIYKYPDQYFWFHKRWKTQKIPKK